jgi:hypothetical protein
MTKRPSLLDSVPTIEERLRNDLASSKAKLLASAKRGVWLDFFIALSIVGSALRAGAWTRWHTIGTVVLLVFCYSTYRAWKIAHEPDV